ncbi:MAG TPA: CorA family divalent cation transporter, partial [Caulobacteraceae bacterium]|nr:CorA family divalent cation transporter [Caulobacteraceae bacterium]
MLNTYPPSAGPEAALWLDLLDPTDAERARAEALFGHALPTRDALSEIETSSRVRARDGVLYMSMPSAAPPPDGGRSGTPVGFILSPERLVTVRYLPSPAFDAVAGRFADAEPAPASAVEVFVALCEEIVDRIADGLEELAAQLAPLSDAAFHVDDIEGRRAVRSTVVLRTQLRTLGRHGDRLSEFRDALAGLGRVVTYAAHHCGASVEPTIRERLASAAQDISSLSDYDVQMFTKIQFLLDALMGLIGIAQNDVFKVLTIVSIVGIPPT